jgi:predicted transposase/invertase (TIGR01784 family)
MPRKLKELIRFDWAMKKMLRNKANFDILEGFLSELLRESIKIKHVLESESNKETANDKYNRVDILVENSKNELLIVEVQNSKEYDYFHRILFGTSKAITEHIEGGEAYAAIKKVISVTIAYFDLGQGKDYVYHGTTNFKGIHKGDVLDLVLQQKELYDKKKVQDIFPEYYLIKVGKFNNQIKDKLDEWIFFLKNGKIGTDFTAQGLPEASKKLDEIELSETDRQSYRSYVRRLHDVASEEYNKMVDAELMRKIEEKAIEKGIEQGIEKGIEKGREQGREEGIEKGKAAVAKKMKTKGMSIEEIAELTGLTIAEINEL